MAPPGDDEFGWSSSDETELLTLEDKENGSKGVNKRALESGDTRPSKRANIESPSIGIQIATQALRQRFGLKEFRLQQAAAISRLLDGDSALCIFPTGGGKSLCYQLPAVVFRELDLKQGIRQGDAESGITLVASPLIALMKDQVDALKRRGISAAVLDSTKSKDEYLETVASMRDGTLDILYCAPERLNNEGFVSSMANVRGGVRLLAIDEAHCISEWGHAFRPDYLKMARFAREIAAERVVCLTATATPKVAEDVCKAFNIPQEGVFRTPSYRSNLALLARSFQTKKESYPELQYFLKGHRGPTVIYVTLQKQAEELAAELAKRKFNVGYYHAGRTREEKAEVQDAFMRSDDMIIIATMAFGMGIDKASIRSVIHYDASRSLEGYSQEIGRAGRDGQQSHCLLYLCAEDFHLRESFARGDLPSKASVEALLRDIFTSTPKESDRGPIIEAAGFQQARAFDIKETVLKNIYAQLELRFGLLRATTPKYTSYSFKTISSIDGDSSAIAQAIRRNIASNKKGRTITHVDVDAVAASSCHFTRTDVVSKLQSWDIESKISLTTGGVVNIYAILKSLPSSEAEQQPIIDSLYKELELREQQDLARMEQVNSLITGSACFSRMLAEHFGDTLPDQALECGSCQWCKTHRPVKLVTPPKKPWDSKAFFAVLNACPERDDPRYLARVAFGIGSPRITQSKLSKHPVFGSMDGEDFMVLLDAFTKICDKEKR